MNSLRVICNHLILLLLLFTAVIFSSCSKKVTVSKVADITPAQLAFERDLFKTYVNEEITPLKGDFRVTVQKFNEAQAKFGTSKDTLILNKIKELKGSINNSLPFNFNEAQQLVHFVSDTLRDDEIAANYYLRLINLANYEGKLKESLHYDSIMKNKYAGYRSDSHKFRMGKVADTYSKINDLTNKGLKEDEYLWQTGVLYSEMFAVTGPFDKGYPVLSYPFSFFRKLLRQYPDSPFADDADYRIMISHDKDEDRISSADQYRWIENYKKFLRAYPTTNCAPEIYERLATLHLQYAQQAELLEPDKQNSYDQSRLYISNLIKDYPQFAKEQKIDALSAQLDSALYIFTWSFQIRSDKKEYQPGEPVIITYDLKNTDTKEKKLSLLTGDDSPNFITYVEYFPLETDIIRYSGEVAKFNMKDLAETGLFVFRTKKTDYSRKDTLIGSNKRYIEKWDILKTSRSSFLESGVGSYKLTREGKYRITARALGDDEKSAKQSNSIWFTIRGNSLSN